MWYIFMFLFLNFNICFLIFCFLSLFFLTFFTLIFTFFTLIFTFFIILRSCFLNFFFFLFLSVFKNTIQFQIKFLRGFPSAFSSPLPAYSPATFSGLFFLGVWFQIIASEINILPLSSNFLKHLSALYSKRVFLL